MIRKVLRIIPVVVLCVAAVLVGASAANASTPAQVLRNAAPSDASLALFSSVCHVIGSDHYNNRGIACADLYYGDSEGTEYMVGENAIYCIDASGNVVDCEGIQETVALCSAGGAGCSYAQSGECGGLWGHSDCGTRVVENFSGIAQSNPCYPNTWADALNTEIVLPHSGDVIGGSGTNVATAHLPAGCNA